MIDKESQEQFRTACFRYAKAFRALAEGLKAAADACDKAVLAFGHTELRPADVEHGAPIAGGVPKEYLDLLHNVIAWDSGRSWALSDAGQKVWTRIVGRCRMLLENEFRGELGEEEIVTLAREVLARECLSVPSEERIARELKQLKPEATS
jgi:hypothetical protein